ncbi:MAG: serine/threonine protein phosphatase [Rhodothermales bacterium]|nr:serine/threonine protein phosphatase [Rhodothermales bacterium]
MSIIAIGDIHGCASTLTALLDELELKDTDHLVFIGDYVDRGPDSRGVIDILRGLQDVVKCTFLRGNHEQLMLNYLDKGEYDLWAMNGGIATLLSYSDAGLNEIPEDDVQFIRDTVSYFETDDFFFVHGGLKANYTIQENLEMFDDETFLWERTHLMSKEYSWEKPVVCGHTPVDIPTNKDLLINIDTGCVYHQYPGRGVLTAVRLPEREFVMVPYAEGLKTE